MAVPSTQKPPYLEKCREMDFGQLRQFIDDYLQQVRQLMIQREHTAAALAAARSRPSETLLSIKKLEERLAFLNRCPCSKEEFLTLWQILRADQRGKQKQKQKQKLKEEFPTLWEMCRGKSSLLFVDGCPRSKYEFLTLWQILRGKAEVATQGELLTWHLQITERVRSDIERAFELGDIAPIISVSWRVLPPGELSVDSLLQHYETLQRHNPGVRYDRDRIIKAFSLHPNRCYVGVDEFEGYIILTFGHTSRVLLECPVFGNAIYILGSNWSVLARLTKQELIAQHHSQVTRIVHAGDWFLRVKEELRIGT